MTRSHQLNPLYTLGALLIGLGLLYLAFQSIGLDDFDAFLEDPTAVAKLERLKETPGKTPREIAKSLAIFSAFTEGVNLFSSFAVLFNFSRFGLLDGIETLVSWSIRDECLAEGTEVLTKEGWKDLKDVTLQDQVMQYNIETKKMN